MNKFLSKFFIVVFFLSAVSFFISCTTVNYKDPYPGIMGVKYENDSVWAVDAHTDKLVIYIEGSGWDSTLGVRGTKRWLYTGYAPQFIRVLGDKYTFLIPEKLKREGGVYDYSGDMEDRANYTVENLLDCYLGGINNFLENNTFYSSIILIGFSEGACLLPMIYEGMNARDKVTAMVSISYGGFSLYESSVSLAVSPYAPPGWNEMYSDITKQFDPENGEQKNSFEEDFYGMTYRWYKSILYIKPFDYYQKINIPVLFIHGEKDYNVPVESTRYIQENLYGKPFEYKYYSWGHGPANYVEMLKFRKDIANWIIKTDAR